MADSNNAKTGKMRIMRTEDVIYPEISFQITGILFQVRKELGIYKNEQQYCDAIEQSFMGQSIKYEREKVLPPSFKGEHLGRNKIDFLVEDIIILEVKAKPFVTKEDYYQARRYLDALNKRLGILVNMRRYYINPKRILNSRVTG